MRTKKQSQAIDKRRARRAEKGSEAKRERMLGRVTRRKQGRGITVKK